MKVIVERCAFLDVHRDTVMACARTPDGAGGRREEVEQFATTTSKLLVLLDWLVERQVTLWAWRRLVCTGNPWWCATRRWLIVGR
jgi:hypothetical protein